ncbi:MAG: glycosyltransferase [Nevskiales bacterium]|nr:glycosyltransferase [Nevskiales bacterium]
MKCNGTDRRRVAIVFNRVPPWLVSNLNASARLMDVAAIELFPVTPDPAGRQIESERFRRIPVRWPDTVGPKGRTPIADLQERIRRGLGQVQPDVVVSLGWSGRRELSGLQWCLANGVPAVFTSDSNGHDFQRQGWREAIKARVVRLYSVAWAAGTTAAAYLAALKMPADRMVIGPVDTIDVAHFSGGADRARQQLQAVRRRLGLPADYFFASSRFAPEKNLQNLLRAFRQYREKAGAGAWSLVLAGDGPLKPDVQRWVAELGMQDSVLLPGWVSFDGLPDYYGLAGAFVHASTREPWGVVVNEALSAGLPVLVSKPCGSAPDLVREGRNGFTFDPRRPQELAGLMGRLAHGDCNRVAMGQVSRGIIQGWTPDRYAESLARVVETALRVPRVRAGRLDRMLLSGLVAARK